MGIIMGVNQTIMLMIHGDLMVILKGIHQPKWGY
jgi:hypothetical protein